MATTIFSWRPDRVSSNALVYQSKPLCDTLGVATPSGVFSPFVKFHLSTPSPPLKRDMCQYTEREGGPLENEEEGETGAPKRRGELEREKIVGGSRDDDSEALSSAQSRATYIPSEGGRRIRGGWKERRGTNTEQTDKVSQDVSAARSRGWLLAALVSVRVGYNVHVSCAKNHDIEREER